MNDLKRIEGKTIASIEKEFDGVNSSIIIKFKEGGKVNISSYPNGDDGVGQFDVELGELKEDDLIGKRIHNITEEFDGSNDFIVFTFKDTSKMTITSFSSSEDSTAGLDITVYSDPDKLVAENLNEFAGKRGRPRKIKEPEPEGDNWYSPDNEFDAPIAGPEQIEDVELEDVVTDIAVQKQIQKRLENELTSPEFNRVSVKFRSPEGIGEGIPMAKLGDKFLLKLKGGGYKKVSTADMMSESVSPRQFVKESFKYYE
jgi:hypothetical protein